MIEHMYILTTGKFNKLPDIYARLGDSIEFTFIFKDRAGVAVDVTAADFKISRGDFISLIEQDEDTGIEITDNVAVVQVDTSLLGETGDYICQLFIDDYVITEIGLTLKSVIGD